jgi:hypothetical protein
MATDSNSSKPTTIPSSFSIPISEKLTKTNYRLWCAQIMPSIRAAQIEGLLLGTDPPPAKMISVKTGNITSEQPNPDYAAWLVRDQALLGYLFSSLTRDALMGVTTATTSAAAWSDLQEMYAPRTCARSVNTRITLANTKKGTTSMAEYFSKIKCYADELASSGQTLTDEEFVAYVLAGLDEEFYNPLVSSIVARAEPISPQELYSQMLSYELRVDKQSGGSYSSANAASRGRGAPWSPRGMPNSGHGRGRSRGNGHGSPTPPSRGGFNTNNSFRCTAPTDSTGGPNRPAVRSA